MLKSYKRKQRCWLKGKGRLQQSCSSCRQKQSICQRLISSSSKLSSAQRWVCIGKSKSSIPAAITSVLCHSVVALSSYIGFHAWQEDAEIQVPEPVRELFAEAGVLNAFPNDRPSSVDDSESYFQTPGNAQSYDWDLKMDTLDDIAEPKEGESEGNQVTPS